MIRFLYVILFLKVGSFCDSKANPDYHFHKDSLENRLKKSLTDEERLETLIHLADIEFSAQDPTLSQTYIWACWNEAIRQKNVMVMDEIAVPLIMRYRAKNQLDSAGKWIQRCKDSFYGPRLRSNIEYVQLMHDIRQYDRYKELSYRLTSQKIHIDSKSDPYKAMRILYTLAVISGREKEVIPSTILRQPLSYLEEAYSIVKTLPFDEGIRFKRQILLALSTYNVTYARLYLNFLNEVADKRKLSDRPFYSRRALITAYDKMILHGKELSESEVDQYYTMLNLLLKIYPDDTPVSTDYFLSRMKFNYFKAKGQVDSALYYSEVLLKKNYEYGDNKVLLYEFQHKTLSSIAQWQKAYTAAVQLMTLRDSMLNQTSENHLVELETLYKVDSLKRRAESRRKQLWLFGGILITLFVILFLVVWYSYKLRKKNRILFQQMNARTQLLRIKNFRDLISGQVVTDLPIESEQLTKTDHCLDKENENQMSKNEGHTGGKELRDIFDKFEHIINVEQLFKNPNLNRDMLVDRLGTNKNKLTEAVSYHRRLHNGHPFR